MNGCSHNEEYIMALDEDGETNICAGCLINDVRNETLDKAIAEIDKHRWKTHLPSHEKYDTELSHNKCIIDIKSALVAMKKSNEPQLPDNIDWGHDPTKDECSSCGHTKELHPEKCDVISCNCVGFTMKIKETK